MEYDEIIDLGKKREYLVVKSNEIIQKARHTLTLQEQKVLNFIISKIKPKDDKLKLYEIEILDYCKVSGIHYNSGKNYEDLKTAIQNLRDKSFYMELEEDGKEALCSWINKAWINKYSGKIWIRLDEDLHKHLIGLTKRFTSYELLYILPMKSQYSIKVYELLKSYSFTKTQSFEIDELKKMLDAENYKNFSDFRKRTIDVATKEINKYTDLKISYDTVTKGRKVVKVNFNIITRSVPEQVQQQNKIIRELDK